VTLLLLLIASILFYAMLKEEDVKYGSVLIYVMLFIFISVIIKEQFAFNTSSKYQTALLTNEYDIYQKKLQEESGTAAPISGADIYNGRCIACHSFERKIVGPPYNQTMPKYEGKKELLVKFIMNPVKVNPDYPAMPNQGLKPNEAEAVADFLLSTYKKK
jgi:cytochrome c